ncbi:MAG: HAMP domain-containing histidine kinase [Candidatus Nanosynbacter sp.]|nr:HAMP domain-containing histidine kinase [Candidatus Nanosynbacter sp.]
MRRIFWKGFFRVLILLLGVVTMIHGGIFYTLSKSYLEEKTKEIRQTASDVTKNLAGKNREYVEQVLDFYSRSGEIKAYLKTQNAENEMKVSELLPVDRTSENNSVIIEEKSVKLKNEEEALVQFVSTANLEKDAIDLSLKFLPVTLLGSVVFSLVVAGFYARQETLRMKQANFEFLRGASHELKTPLTSLKIVLENMQFKVGKYKDRDFYLEKCGETVDELDAGIRELLLMSKMDSFEKSEWIKISEVVEESLRRNQIMIAEKNLHIRMEVGEQKIWLNRTALSMVLANLIGNAVKYAEEGGKISVQMRDEELEIKNSYRAGTNEQSGSGLGLYIVKNLLKRYGLKYEIYNQKKSFSFRIDFGTVKKGKTLAQTGESRYNIK